MPSATLRAPQLPAVTPPRMPTATTRIAAAPEAAVGAEAASAALGSVAAAAAGPVGALLVADLAASKMAGVFNTVQSAVEGFGHQLASAAGNDYLGMFKKGLDSIHHPLKNIPIAGKVFESQLQAAIAPVRAFTVAIEAFTSRAHELAAFNPAIALAEQRADLREMFDDFKEADTLGTDLARMVDAQSGITHELRELLLPVKKVVVEVLANVLEWLKEAIVDIKGTLAGLKELAKIQFELFNDIFGSGKIKDIPDLLKNIPDRIAKAVKEAMKEASPNLNVDPWLNNLMGGDFWRRPEFNVWDEQKHEWRPNIAGIQNFGGL